MPLPRDAVLLQVTVVLAVAAVASATIASQAEKNYTAHAGLQFKKVARVLATSSVLVRFDMDLTPHTAVAMDQQVDELEKALVNHTSEYAKYIRGVMDIMRGVFKRENDHYETVRNLTEVITSNKSRRRRSPGLLPFIGDWGRFCCGFSTYNDIQVAYERDEVLREFAKGLKGSIMQLDEIRKEDEAAINDYAHQVDDNFRNLSAEVAELADEVHITSGRLTYFSLLVSQIFSLSSDKLLTAQRLESINAACSADRIPMEAVSPEKLSKAVEKIEGEHRDLRLAAETLMQLYRLEIAACMKMGPEQLTIMVKVPVLPKGEGWTAYNVVPLGFLYSMTPGEPSVCRLLPEEVMVAESADGHQLRVMSPQQRDACLAKRICEVPRLGEAPGVSRACIHGISQLRPDRQNVASSLPTLLKDCKFTCMAYSDVEVTHVEQNWYSVVNLNRTLVVDCPHKDYVTLPPVREGALFVEVPCNCTLMDITDTKHKPVVLVATMDPCEAGLAKEPSYVFQVPALWSNDTNVIVQLEGLYKLTQAPKTTIYDWHINIRTFNRTIDVPVTPTLPGGKSDTFAAAAGLFSVSGTVATMWLIALTVVQVMVIHKFKGGAAGARTKMVFTGGAHCKPDKM